MVITIGGSFGCGGKAIASRVAELLGYRLCNDEIITEAVKDSPFDMKEETFRYFDESQGSAPLSELAHLSGVQRSGFVEEAVRSLSYDVVPLDRAMAEIQSSVMNRLADEGNCILLGRCADHFLAGRDDVLSVFVIDEEENCIDRLKEYYPEMSEREIKKLIKKTDKRREDYYCFFTNKRWGDAANYGMILNLALLGGAENAAVLLAGAVKARENA